MSDEPNPFEEVEYVDHVDDDGTIHFSDDAPDGFLEALEENREQVEAEINFVLTIAMDSWFDSAGYSVAAAQRLSEWHYSKVDEAVDAGDIDDAQEHKKLAGLYSSQYKTWLYGGDADAR